MQAVPAPHDVVMSCQFVSKAWATPKLLLIWPNWCKIFGYNLGLWVQLTNFYFTAFEEGEKSCMLELKWFPMQLDIGYTPLWVQLTCHPPHWHATHHLHVTPIKCLWGQISSCRILQSQGLVRPWRVGPREVRIWTAGSGLVGQGFAGSLGGCGSAKRSSTVIARIHIHDSRKLKGERWKSC